MNPDIRNFTFAKQPPSVNAQKTLSNGRFIKSQSYKNWERDVLWRMRDQNGFIETKPFLFKVEIFVPKSCQMDLDNVPKALLDVLIKANKIPDDRYMVEIWAGRWHVAYTGVTITRVDPEKYRDCLNCYQLAIVGGS